MALSKKEKIIQRALGTLAETKVTYSTNNSGGHWWLKTSDWLALEKAGWTVVWRSDPKKAPEYMGTHATEAFKLFENVAQGIDEWESVLGMDSTEPGCDCCGAPHGFHCERVKG